MVRTLPLAVLLATVALLASPWVTRSDHLKCYRIKDSATRIKYTADISFAPSRGGGHPRQGGRS